MLSRLARDLLPVPATGAGVEKLFNIARDIRHYRRGSFHEATIQDLMMYMCSEKFNLEGEEVNSPGIADGERELEQDEALKVKEEDVEPISDDEEVEESEDMEGNIELEASYKQKVYW